ncbi:MAG TPA: hypothetical protein VNN20_03940 [Thermodesulfobacteriota bacterium]|nr:hypothetical protein [Thermodesulfobacteriota bacterium]
MEEQLASVSAKVKDFRQIKPEDFAVIRFRPKDLKLLDTPMEFSRDDSSVKASYYILLNHKKTPRLLEIDKEFKFVAGHKKKKALTKSTYEEHSSDIDLVQNKIQTAIYQQLSRKFGKANVGTEISTGYGSQIDVVLRGDDGGYTFYEIKTSYSVRLCIRDALAQLIEYAYFPRENKAKKLIIVSPNLVTPEAQSYLKWLRERFSIPVYYQRYDPEVQALEDTVY